MIRSLVKAATQSSAKPRSLQAYSYFNFGRDNQYKQYNSRNQFGAKGLGIVLGLGLGVTASLAFAVFTCIFLDLMIKADKEPPSASLAQSTVVTGFSFFFLVRKAESNKGTHPAGGFAIITLSKSADLKAVAKAASQLPKLIVDISGVQPDKVKPGELPPLMAGIAFGTQTWQQIAKTFRLGTPGILYFVLVYFEDNFGHYSARKGTYGDMPATGGDILLHVKAESKSLCFETIKAFVNSLPKGSVEKVEDEYGFQFQEGRDLSGFLDGTENPNDNSSRRAAALLNNGGSYVIHQRWIHNVKDFESKPLSEQEKIVGRSKPDSAEFPLKEMAATAHVRRMRDEKFQKIPIVRQSMPFGTFGGENGLLFIAYSNSVSKFDTMLDRMVGKSGGTENDATMTYSKCVKSQYYYAPALKELSYLK